MAWWEALRDLGFVVCGYLIARLFELARSRQPEPDRPSAGGQPGAPEPSATNLKRVAERRAIYARFRRSVDTAAGAAVNQGLGTYGMLYQIRDDYSELVRDSPDAVRLAAESVNRCVALLVNLGPSDQRYAMLTRALRNFDNECARDRGIQDPAHRPARVEHSVVGDDPGSEPEAGLQLPAASRTASGGPG